MQVLKQDSDVNVANPVFELELVSTDPEPEPEPNLNLPGWWFNFKI